MEKFTRNEQSGGAECSLTPHLKQNMGTNTTEKSHSCEVCGSVFSYESNLMRHMLTHTGEKLYSSDGC